MVVVSDEGLNAVDHNVKDNTAGPDIRLLPILAKDDSRGQEVGSAGHFLEAVIFTFGRRGNAKVDESDDVVLSDHDVLRLDVPMDQLLLVTVVNRQHQLPHVLASVRGKLQRGLILERFEQSLPVDVLHHKVDKLVVVVGLHVLDNVWMVERTKSVNLLLQHVDFVFDLAFVDDFDGDHDFFVRPIRRLVHFAVGSRADQRRGLIDIVVLS